MSHNIEVTTENVKGRRLESSLHASAKLRMTNKYN